MDLGHERSNNIFLVYTGSNIKSTKSRHWSKVLIFPDSDSRLRLGTLSLFRNQQLTHLTLNRPPRANHAFLLYPSSSFYSLLNQTLLSILMRDRYENEIGKWY